ncbi:MAG: dipeptide ABC transporter ATP-binding protein [Pseudoxanthomonas sp.]
MAQTLLEIDNLGIRFGNAIAVDGLSLKIERGERFALVGESGSGKTATAKAILQLIPEASTSGAIRLQDRNLLALSQKEIAKVRGSKIAMIFQDPMSALNPLFPVGKQIAESILLHEGCSRKEARERAIGLLARTGVPEPELKVDSYPHQLSGGQCQRAMIAMAIACKPDLLIADEPTTALDVRTRGRIVQMLLDLQVQEAAAGRDMAILLITHDLQLVRRFADRVGVMEKGLLVETQETESLYRAPAHPYTRRLLNSMPPRLVEPIGHDARILLEAKALRVDYARPATSWRQWLKPLRHSALLGIDVVLRAGETVGIVGESGSGKSTLAQSLLGLVGTAGGDIRFDGKRLAPRDWHRIRPRLQAVFQNPFGALSPRHTVRSIVSEGLRLHSPALDLHQVQQRVASALSDVGIPLEGLDAFPHEFSGGQRQRIAIARVLVLRPQVLILDEPTSALDVSVQAQVLRLLVELQRKYGLSYLLVTHDLAVIRAVAHRVYVMKEGRVLEAGPTLELIEHPRQPYTQELVNASL